MSFSKDLLAWLDAERTGEMHALLSAWVRKLDDANNYGEHGITLRGRCVIVTISKIVQPSLRFARIGGAN